MVALTQSASSIPTAATMSRHFSYDSFCGDAARFRHFDFKIPNAAVHAEADKTDDLRIFRRAGFTGRVDLIQTIA